jgi:hypothetical protein
VSEVRHTSEKEKVMKTRSGFVSNSSSSSFVIAFSKKPCHSYEVLEEMFPLDKTGRSKGVGNPYGEGVVDALSAATLVWVVSAYN